MSKCTAATRFPFTVLIISLAAVMSGGCTNTPSMGEVMKASSTETSELARRWNDGNSIFREGEKLLASGNRQIEDGEEMIEKARARIRQGERNQQRGNQLMEQGRSQMARSEKEFAEKYPDRYREFGHDR